MEHGGVFGYKRIVSRSSKCFVGFPVLTTDPRPICIRIANRLLKFLQVRSPRLDAGSFIEWDPRCFNSLADHAANVVLDQHGDWHMAEQHLIDQAREEHVNIHLAIDGARRGDGTSAGGIVLAASRAPGQEIPMLRAGKSFGVLHSSFEAELMALEWGMSIVTDLLFFRNAKLK